MLENQMMERLINNFDEFRERLTRIEEGIKPIGDIKKDVDTLKISVSEISASTKSAHKRLDALDKDIDELPTQSDHDSHEKRIGKLEKIVYWVGTTIIGSVILAMLGVVLLNK